MPRRITSEDGEAFFDEESLDTFVVYIPIFSKKGHMTTAIILKSDF